MPEHKTIQNLQLTTMDSSISNDEQHRKEALVITIHFSFPTMIQ
jgi:hypothetical protein